MRLWRIGIFFALADLAFRLSVRLPLGLFYLVCVSVIPTTVIMCRL